MLHYHISRCVIIDRQVPSQRCVSTLKEYPVSQGSLGGSPTGPTHVKLPSVLAQDWGLRQLCVPSVHSSTSTNTHSSYTWIVLLDCLCFMKWQFINSLLMVCDVHMTIWSNHWPMKSCHRLLLCFYLGTLLV